MQRMFTRSALALAGLATCFAQRTNQSEDRPEYRLSGPFTHDNLTIFLIHGVSRPAKMLRLQVSNQVYPSFCPPP